MKYVPIGLLMNSSSGLYTDNRDMNCAEKQRRVQALIAIKLLALIGVCSLEFECWLNVRVIFDDLQQNLRI